MTKCFGFRGKVWEEGEIVEVLPSENPPKHFMLLEEVSEVKKTEPHRTEPMEMVAGKNREVIGGLGNTMEGQKIPRIMTTDKVPNNVKSVIKRKANNKRRAKG